ncbi:ExbD/TolR family protein [Sphingomonas beigongshangi]|uniref:ExbD/TolR family protein n=1 Tax=Sphingomonas beigongshangi TaxID=2782540 RepID=UPI00193B31C9|nr:biopolymer transporter ExbD [Sphingomonas beigongshangi]
MRRQRAFAPSYAAAPVGEPLSELNITPLIDVMLVLLVMMILTLPQVLHKVPIDLPQDVKVPLAERVTHSLALLRDGGVVLDGAPVPVAALPARLAAVKADPKALLVMRTDPETRYERFDQTLAVVKRAGITRLGFVGNGPL